MNALFLFFLCSHIVKPEHDLHRKIMIHSIVATVLLLAGAALLAASSIPKVRSELDKLAKKLHLGAYAETVRIALGSLLILSGLAMLGMKPVQKAEEAVRTVTDAAVDGVEKVAEVAGDAVKGATGLVTAPLKAAESKLEGGDVASLMSTEVPRVQGGGDVVSLMSTEDGAVSLLSTE